MVAFRLDGGEVRAWTRISSVRACSNHYGGNRPRGARFPSRRFPHGGPSITAVWSRGSSEVLLHRFKDSYSGPFVQHL